MSLFLSSAQLTDDVMHGCWTLLHIIGLVVWRIRLQMHVLMNGTYNNVYFIKCFFFFQLGSSY